MIPQEDLTSYGSNGNTPHTLPKKATDWESKHRLLKAEEVAVWLQVSKETVLRYRRKGKLQGVKTSRKNIRFSREQVQKLIDSNSDVETSCDNGKKRGKIESRSSKVVARGGRCGSSRKSWGDLRKEVLECR